MFFVDLEPALINKDIFSVTFLLHAKVKITESQCDCRTNVETIIQCQNCQVYGHLKK